MTLVKRFLFALVVCLALPSAAQNKGTGPEKFTISGTELGVILHIHQDRVIILPSNPILDKGTVEKNVRNGDMQFVRIKLASMKDAYLNVQVNGEHTTQVFVMSEKDAAFYRGELKEGNVVMEKCSKDDIVVE